MYSSLGGTWRRRPTCSLDIRSVSVPVLGVLRNALYETTFPYLLTVCTYDLIYVFNSLLYSIFINCHSCSRPPAQAPLWKSLIDLLSMHRVSFGINFHIRSVGLIGVGAQSTWGGGHFCPKINVCKINKNARILHHNCLKNIVPEFLGGRAPLPPSPT